jgi:archaellum component FlaF (FlaF/FlaG flagellin family)
MWALDTTFQERNRFQCQVSSRHAGLECTDEGVGCACILGFLDNTVGSKSSSSSSYSNVSFCSLDPYESICSKYIDRGEEMRWIVALSYWVSFVQRYDTYMGGLQSFVEGGMRDTSFVESVADITIYDAAQKAPIEKFISTYFRVSKSAPSSCASAFMFFISLYVGGLTFFADYGAAFKQFGNASTNTAHVTTFKQANNQSIIITSYQISVRGTKNSCSIHNSQQSINGEQLSVGLRGTHKNERVPATWT